MQSPHVTVQEGTAVYFCGAGCKTKFLARVALESDAEQVVRAATVPVLLVRGSSQGKKEPVVTLIEASAA
jgi:hypothetical protein